MSHLALRRVTIRLLHDPVFAAAVRADADRALAGVDLTADERGWLLAQPAAAWRTDAGRSERVLAALAEEYPATLARTPNAAAAFMQSPEFHGAVQERGSLAGALGDHLARTGDRATRVLARLEQAVAAVRRAPRAPRPSPAGRLRRSPRARVLRLPAGALELLAAVRRGDRGPRLGTTDEPVLVALAPGATDVTLEALDPALAALLERAAPGCAAEELAIEAGRHGADPDEAREVVGRLVGDGLLC
jgi:hypothetical protein